MATTIAAAVQKLGRQWFEKEVKDVSLKAINETLKKQGKQTWGQAALDEVIKFVTRGEL